MTQQRLDTWLWACRFYKSRKLAHAAVSSGHVTVDGRKTKPAKTINVGQRITIRKSGIIYEVTVIGISLKRVGAKLVNTLYQETESSKTARLAHMESLKLNRAGLRFDRRKPTKQDRRKLRSLKYDQ